MRYTITRGEDEIELEIEYDFHRAYRGRRDSLGGRMGAGPPLEPDEPAHIEITSAKDENGDEIELTEAEEIAIEEQAMNNMADAAADYPEPDDR